MSPLTLAKLAPPSSSVIQEICSSLVAAWLTFVRSRAVLRQNLRVQRLTQNRLQQAAWLAFISNQALQGLAV